MLFRKNIFVLCALGFVVLVCTASMPGRTNYSRKWVILEDCTVKVNGRTNVSKFSCVVDGNSKNDTLTCFINEPDGGPVVLQGSMALPVLHFDCANKMMTRDLQKTLKEKEYPAFYIHFISMERYPLLKPSEESLGGDVTIELAGVEKQIQVNYKISMNNQGIIKLAGRQIIHFSDFNLATPRKLGGMIKTSDDLDVEFTVHCRVIK